MTLGDAAAKVKSLPEAGSLPTGVRIQESGDAEIMGEVFAGFAAAMGAGLLMVLGVLVLLFHNVFQPITILLSLPLSIGGVIAGLLLTGNADQHAGRDRHPDADGHRHQERDHAGRFRGGAGTQGHAPDRSDHRRRPQARPAHHHDDHRDGGGHAPQRHGEPATAASSAPPWRSR